MMITLTQSAKTHIQSMLKSKTDAFRLSVKKTGCSGYMYVPEIVDKKKKETDIEVMHDDLRIYIDSESANILKGTKIDYVKKSLGVYQLEYINPNADSLCGCGESFNLKKTEAHANERSE